MAIKVSLGKLTLNFEEPFSEAIGGQLRENGITVLPLALTHIGQVAAMPFHHRDPFDRLIVAQALVDGFDAADDALSVIRSRQALLPHSCEVRPIHFDNPVLALERGDVPCFTAAFQENAGTAPRRKMLAQSPKSMLGISFARHDPVPRHGSVR
jgi:hypothetical protein